MFQMIALAGHRRRESQSPTWSTTHEKFRIGGCGTFMKKLKLGMQSSEFKIPLPSGQAVGEDG
jgi:hypothetical protein